jgi:hypothetical protein
MMRESEFTARETILFARATLLTRQAAARWRPMARRQGFVGVVLVHGQQAPLGATPNKDHRAAGTLAQPAVAFERGEAGGECRAQVGTGR